LVRAWIDSNAAVRPTGVQASHILSSLAAANALVDIPADTVLEPGALVRVITW
jgi:molybdopterin biosynthesis enzyme